jgi:hypothetical protein
MALINFALCRDPRNEQAADGFETSFTAPQGDNWERDNATLTYPHLHMHGPSHARLRKYHGNSTELPLCYDDDDARVNTDSSSDPFLTLVHPTDRVGTKFR